MIARSPFHAARAALLAALLLAVCAAPALAGSGWDPTGSMSLPTRAHGVALLTDGRVLVASGDSSSGDVPAAELYDPATGSWTAAAPPLVPRHDATATLLNDGRVLLAGGKTAIGTIAHAELYDPVANTWTATGALNEQREEHVAVLLPDGRVLVAGGIDDSNSASATGEVYDPGTGAWTLTGDAMSDGRQSGYAALLDDGRVLVAGGLDSTTPNQRSADIYDPATDSWSPTGALAEARGEGGTAVLPDGRVLVAGAATGSDYVSSTELYDPVTGSWSAGGPIPYPGSYVAAVALDDGRVLIQSDGSASTALFDPATNAVTQVEHQASALRSQPSLTRLEDGRVLMAGGSDLASAELFTPPTERSSTVSSGFGDVRVGSTAERDVTVENSGGNRLWIDGTALTGAAATDYAIVADDCTGAELLPAETCVVRVRFTPSARGERAAELSFDDNAELSDDLDFDGAGVVPGLEADASSLVFDAQQVGTTSAPRTVELIGAGAPVTIGTAVVDGPFSVAAEDCDGEVLAPGERCTLSIAFTPTAAGATSGTVTIPSDAADGPVTVALAGEGTARAVTPDPPREPAPDQPRQQQPTPQRPAPPRSGPRTAAKPPAIVRFALARQCVRPTAGGSVGAGLVLKLTRQARVRIEISRAIGTRGRTSCPRGGRFDGDLEKPLVRVRGTTRMAVASSVTQRHTLRLRLRPALYRITVRPYTGRGRYGRPAHRWLRVLTP